MNDRNYDHQDRDDGKTQLFIAKGKNDGTDQRSLVDFIVKKVNIDPAKISNVKILDAFSFFAVPAEDAGTILDFFQAEAGEGRPLVSKAKRKKPNNGFGDNRGGHRSGGFGGGERRSFDRNNDRGGFRNRNNNGGGF